MDHKYLSQYPQKMPPKAAFLLILFLSLVFALLIGDSAAGLTGGLARSLALTATALLCTFAKILGFQSLNVFHNQFLRWIIFIIVSHFFR